MPSVQVFTAVIRNLQTHKNNSIAIRIVIRECPHMEIIQYLFIETECHHPLLPYSNICNHTQVIQWWLVVKEW